MKTKIVVLIGLAICTVLLVSPALANGVDTLEIYGNANEDNTIDMRDLTYVKLVFFGKKPETELADAKYDGMINPLDFIQIKLIIVGKEKELTVVDSADRIVTVKKPIERIVVILREFTHAIVALGAKDRIVGIAEPVTTYNSLLPEVSKLPSVGIWWDPDIEAILELNPDTVCVMGTWPSPEKVEDKLPDTITVIRMYFFRPETMKEEMEKLGYLLDKEDVAGRYLEWHDKYVDAINEKVSEISEENKVRVFMDNGGGISSRGTFLTGSTEHPLCVMAGGINIAYTEGSSGYREVETEWILDQKPDVIAGISCKGGPGEHGGYDTDEDSGMKAYYDEIIELPGFKEGVPAVINDHVFVMPCVYTCGPHYPASLATTAKWFYPDLFEDLNPQAIHQEYLDTFLGIDYNVYEQGVFVYPYIYPEAS
nr:putative iron(III) ABC transporter, periplasmic binding protein [uncultured archaeon]CBH38514.1 putative iron(III) ABC transporter, solute-binding protein [uncultured archaeon]